MLLYKKLLLMTFGTSLADGLRTGVLLRVLLVNMYTLSLFRRNNKVRQLFNINKNKFK